MSHRILWSIALLLISSPVIAAPLTFDSGLRQVQLIELYTSQGCSSCPPADEWLSQLNNQPGLWTQRVPVAFHVDYWDYIGWSDVFADSRFSKRQRQHRTLGQTSGVYTPGFLVDGREWRGFFSREALPLMDKPAGRLTATLDNDHLSASFTNVTAPVRLHIAVLGMGLMTEVKRGENRGRLLRHDFSVLHYQVHDSNSGQWEEVLSMTRLPPAERYAIALWITPTDSLKPLQATGGWAPIRVIADEKGENL